MSLGLIWAQARGGVLGRDGGIPWHLPEDLAHFREVTLGHPVIMGRRTWDSLEPRYRPLPRRRNIVVTRDPSWEADGASVAHSIGAALALAGDGETWIIGGAQLYAATLALADVLEVTELDLAFDAGEAFAPALGPEWIAASSSPPEPAAGSAPLAAWHHSTGGIPYRFRRYRPAR